MWSLIHTPPRGMGFAHIEYSWAQKRDAASSYNQSVHWNLIRLDIFLAGLVQLIYLSNLYSHPSLLKATLYKSDKAQSDVNHRHGLFYCTNISTDYHSKHIPWEKWLASSWHFLMHKSRWTEVAAKIHNFLNLFTDIWIALLRSSSPSFVCFFLKKKQLWPK